MSARSEDEREIPHGQWLMVWLMGDSMLSDSKNVIFVCEFSRGQPFCLPEQYWSPHTKSNKIIMGNVKKQNDEIGFLLVSVQAYLKLS